MVVTMGKPKMNRTLLPENQIASSSIIAENWNHTTDTMMMLPQKKLVRSPTPWSEFPHPQQTRDQQDQLTQGPARLLQLT
jgi:hypothetical protein